jgi:hypothetical protein
MILIPHPSYPEESVTVNTEESPRVKPAHRQLNQLLHRPTSVIPGDHLV